MFEEIKEDFIILGCGPSAHTFTRPRNVKIIGVNDCNDHSRVVLDYHVVIDGASRFTPERLETIENTRAKVLFTQQPSIVTKAIERMNIKLQRERVGLKMDRELIDISTTSTFVAACIALRLGAKSLAFVGVDLVDHPNFKNNRVIEQTKCDFEHIMSYCRRKNIRTFNLGMTGNIFTGMACGSADEFVAYKKIS